MLKKLDTRIKLALIYGSGREGRFCDKVAGWAISQIEGDGPFELAIIDPGELELPPRHVGSGHPAIEEVRQVIDWADGFIVVTPEYNHGASAVLKNALDYAYKEFNRKPIAFVGYGGVGAARSVEHLRMVAVELQMAPIRFAVHIGMIEFLGVWQQGKSFDDFPHLGQAATAMFEDMAWWTQALKAARETQD